MLRDAGWEIEEVTKTGRITFKHPAGPARVHYDGTLASRSREQPEHWHIKSNNKTDDDLDHNGRVRPPTDNPNDLRHIPRRRR